MKRRFFCQALAAALAIPAVGAAAPKEPERTVTLQHIETEDRYGDGWRWQRVWHDGRLVSQYIQIESRPAVPLANGWNVEALPYRYRHYSRRWQVI